MYRRQLLQSVSVGAAAVAGCSGRIGSAPQAYLDGITVRNGDGFAHEFTLRVERDDSVVQETTLELARAEFVDGDLHVPQSSVGCEWSEPGHFVVMCTIDTGRSEAVEVPAELEQGAGDYAEVTFTATDAGGVDWSGYLDDGGLRCGRSSTE